MRFSATLLAVCLAVLVVKSAASKVEIEDKATSDPVLEEELKLDDEKPVSYSGAQLWRVLDADKLTPELEEKFEADVWRANHSHAEVMIKSAKLEEAKNFLKASGLKYDVLIDDLGVAFADQNPPEEEIQEWQNRHGHPLTWKAYHRIKDIYAFVDHVAKSNPDLAETFIIGKSHKGTPLKVLRIGNKGNSAIWVDGGIHAREWISPATVTCFANQLIEEWDDQPDYVRNIDWYFLSVVNPDGYEFSHTNDRMWRKNRSPNGQFFCKGVDLNRNYGYHWCEKGASKYACSEIYCGTAPFSEPETRAVRDFLLSSTKKRRFVASLSMHSYGHYILFPFGHDNKLAPDHKDLERVARKAATRMRKVNGNSYTVGPAAITLYPAAGGSDDWAKMDAGIKYAYTVELPDNGRYGFALPAKYIESTCNEAKQVFYTVAEAAQEQGL